MLKARLGEGCRAVDAMEKEQDGRTAVRKGEGTRLCCGLCGKAPARATPGQHAGRTSTSRITLRSLAIIGPHYAGASATDCERTHAHLPRHVFLPAPSPP